MPKLLIIEDKPNLRESLRIAFEGPFYQVWCAESAEQGLLCVWNWEPDVVITDYRLPGMNGVELIARIKTNYTNEIERNTRECSLQHIGWQPIPRIILISARMDGELEQKALAAGADGCLGKPFDLREMTMMVSELLKA
jgi:CheY-like chemotaxis protein